MELPHYLDHLDIAGLVLVDLDRATPVDPHGAEPRRDPIQVTIDYLAVENGTFELDHQRIPLALTARAVQGFMSGGPGLHIQGRVAAQEVEVTLPKARPFLGAVGLKVGVDPGRIELAGGRVSGPDITAAIQGHAGWKDDR